MSNEIIKEVNELNEQEVYLLLHDELLQDNIYSYAYQIELHYIDDILKHIKPYINKYNIVPCSNNYIEVADAIGFIKGVNELYRIHGLLNSNEVIDALNKLNNHEVSNDDIDDYVNIISNHISDRVMEYLTYYDSIDKIQRETDYIDTYLEIIHDAKCLVTNNSVTLIQ